MAYYKEIQPKQGYTQMKMNYINDVARTILRLTTEMEYIWRVQKDVKDNVDMEKVMESSRIEIENQIEYLQGYLKPFEREEEWNTLNNIEKA